MARNVEIKASVRSVEDLIERVGRIADSGPGEIAQDDTFFACDKGRLKLREFADGSGELIFYSRAESTGPKTCHYEIVPIDKAGPLRNLLVLALGRAGRVRKLRTLYMVGRSRVHIDRVDGLGTFVELEVVLGEGEGEEAGVREARELMAALGIEDHELIDLPYVDLLNEKGS